MISDITTYQIADFIPFEQETFLFLLQDYHEFIYPQQFYFLAANLLIFSFCLKQPAKKWPKQIALIYLAICWAYVGYFFHLQYFDMLVWAGEVFAFLHFIQSLVLIGCAFTLNSKAKFNLRATRIWLILFFLISFFPLPLLYKGYSSDIEGFGWSWWPTALGSLFLLPVLVKSWKLWVSLILPLFSTICALLLRIGLA